MSRSIPRVTSFRAVGSGLAAIGAIMRRELYSYLVSPMVYVVTAVFLFLNGTIFARTLTEGSAQPTLEPVIPTTAFLLLLILPVLTMRLLAEEKATGTVELLMTFPVTDTQVILGKYFATVATYCLMLVPTLAYVVILGVLGNTEWGPLITAYVGLILFGAAVIAIGMLTSSITRSQIVAGVVGIGFLVALWIAGIFAPVVSPQAGPVFQYLSVSEHLNSFAQGVITLKDTVYFLSVAAVGVFLSIQIFQSARWRA